MALPFVPNDPSSVSVCRGTITLRTLRAVLAAGTAGPDTHLARARAAILTLATGTFAVPGGRVKTVTLRLRPRARRLLERRRVLRARATLVMRDSAGALQSSHATVTLRLARRRRH